MTGYLHVIPFDLGYAFDDVLNVDNYQNLLLADEFISLLEHHYSYHPEVMIKRTFHIEKLKNRIVHHHFSDDLMSESVCRIRFSSLLHGFILKNGIICFLLYEAYEEKTIIKMIHRKKSSQRLILENLSEIEHHSILDEIQMMRDFMKHCWNVIHSVAKQKRIKCYRPYSSNFDYKYGGLSYVLTIYLVERNKYEDKELHYLLYSLHGDYRQLSEEQLKNKINDFKVDKVYESKSNQISFMFSWSAVLAQLNHIPSSMDQIMEIHGLRRLIKQEVFLQSRWFLADNSMDNGLKSLKKNSAGLKRLENILEHNEAEVYNIISANMTTEEKSISENIVVTSGLEQLNKSVKRQLSIQMRIYEEKEYDSKKRNMFILSLFMAIFTACSLYSEVYVIINGDNHNFIILFVLLVITISTVVIDYLYR